MTYDKLTTLQLRPHVDVMLSAMTARIRAAIVAMGKSARITESSIVRHLIKQGKTTPEALRYAIGERVDEHGEVHNLVKLRPGMAPYVQHRVRMSAEDVNRLQALAAQLHVSTSRVVAALIVTAQKELPADPDWELLDQGDTRTTTTTEDTHD